MKRIVDCRRTFVACLALALLFILAYRVNTSESLAAIAPFMAAICGMVAGSNAWENVKKGSSQ